LQSGRTFSCDRRSGAPVPHEVEVGDRHQLLTADVDVVVPEVAVHELARSAGSQPRFGFANQVREPQRGVDKVAVGRVAPDADAIDARADTEATLTGLIQLASGQWSAPGPR